LVELSGLMCFPKLQDLYASFNNIKDLTPIADAYNLVVLDVEGNDILEIK
jgi:Leucine-rich repeat (LRR) protein